MKELFTHLKKKSTTVSHPLSIFKVKDDNRMESNSIRMRYGVLMPWPIRTKLKFVNYISIYYPWV